MIEVVQGDLLASRVDALVNAVNTAGVMGKGIALQFRQKFPEMFSANEGECRSGRMRVGKVHFFDRGDSSAPGRWIINFPTKRNWREPSRLETWNQVWSIS